MRQNSPTEDLKPVSAEHPDAREQLESSKSKNSSLPTSEKMVNQYKIIGDTLSTCEISFIGVGVPWLPLDSRRTTSKQTVEKNLRDFIRYSLVPVPTETLQCYLEDLESLPISDYSASVLNIPRPGWKARIPFIGACLAFSLAVGSIAAFTLLLALYQSILLCLIACWTGITLALVTCSDPYRRYTFFSALTKEVDRRRGSTPGKGGKLRVCFSCFGD